MHISDAKLLDSLKSGNPQSVRSWFIQYHSKLLRYVSGKISSKADAEDIVQEIFVNSLRQLPLFSGKSSLWTWMCAIARHEIADYYRRRYAKRALKSLPLSQFLELDSLEISDQGEAYANSTAGVVVVLSKMKATQSELLQLKYVDGKSVAEIAHIVGRTIKAVEAELFRARIEFKTVWSKVVLE